MLIMFIESKKGLNSNVKKNHSIKISNYLKKIIDNDNEGKIAKQFIPDNQELNFLSYESDDPISDISNTKQAKMVHRYKDRILILTTNVCYAYCRYCFRRHLTNKNDYSISENEINEIISYLNDNPQIHEVILSGGDPLTLDLEKFDFILSKLHSINRKIVIRISTRAPVVNPSSISTKFVSLISKYKPLWLIIHVNSVEEVTNEFIDVVQKLNRAGVPILSQTVLLKGINNSVDELKSLFYSLLENNIKPYYLFHGDLAIGTSHFRTNLNESINIVKELRTQISGIAMPQLAVDLPGGGKIPLGYNYYVSEEEDYYLFKNIEDKIFKWPKE